MNLRYRSLLDLCRGQPCYLRMPGCTGGGEDTVPCHANWHEFGKGMGIKASDVYVVPGCAHCHRELDQGKAFTREQRHEIWMSAFIHWILTIFEQGMVVVAGAGPKREPRYAPLRKIVPHPGVPV